MRFDTAQQLCYTFFIIEYRRSWCPDARMRGA